MIELKKKIAPEYPRIPHLAGKSNMTEDDVQTEIIFPVEAYVQEKIDGANCGVSWLEDGPILRNRDHVLNKGYMKDTPAKKQFVPAWNWLHAHEKDLKKMMNRWGGQLTVYGEWMLAKHSLEYDKLPDYFIAYDVWSCLEKKFVSPSMFAELFEGTDIKYIAGEKRNLTSFEDVKEIMNQPSIYRDGMMEGVAVKIIDASGKWIEKMFKVVRSDFKRDDDFNKKMFEKNKIVKS